jgi:nicotinamide-nucleotide amidase
MPKAEIITIGTELLLGEIVDTNAQFLAHRLRETGIDVYRKTTVGDNVKRIAQAIQQSMQRCEIIITTGGLGPTVDDPTREAVAQAIGAQSEFHPELWQQIEARFKKLGRNPTENNRRQAFIPTGAIGIENPVGTAPIFIVEHKSRLIIALPGVPGEMSYLMDHAVIPYLQKHLDLHGVLQTRILHTIGVGESQIDNLIGDLERMSNPTVGLAAHSGQVDVRITVKADSCQAAGELITPVESTLRKRLGQWIYGTDEETLEEVALRGLIQNSWTLTICEAGLHGNVIRHLATTKGPFIAGQVLSEPLSMDQLIKLSDDYRKSNHADVGLGVSLMPSTEAQEVSVVLITPQKTQQFSRQYGGLADYAQFWAYNYSLDLLRRITDDSKS